MRTRRQNRKKGSDPNRERLKKVTLDPLFHASFADKFVGHWNGDVQKDNNSGLKQPGGNPSHSEAKACSLPLAEARGNPTLLTEEPSKEKPATKEKEVSVGEASDSFEDTSCSQASGLPEGLSVFIGSNPVNGSVEVLINYPDESGMSASLSAELSPYDGTLVVPDAEMVTEALKGSFGELGLPNSNSSSVTVGVGPIVAVTGPSKGHDSTSLQKFARSLSELVNSVLQDSSDMAKTPANRPQNTELLGPGLFTPEGAKTERH